MIPYRVSGAIGRIVRRLREGDGFLITHGPSQQVCAVSVKAGTDRVFVDFFAKVGYPTANRRDAVLSSPDRPFCASSQSLSGHHGTAGGANGRNPEQITDKFCIME